MSFKTLQKKSAATTSKACFTFASFFIISKGKSDGFTTPGGNSTTLGLLRLRSQRVGCVEGMFERNFGAIHHSC